MVARLGARDARRDDLAILVDEVLEHGDVLVVDLLHLLRGETAELAAPEKAAVLVAGVLALGELAALLLVAGVEPRHWRPPSARARRAAALRSRCAISLPSSSATGPSRP